MSVSRRQLEALGEPICPQLPTKLDRRCGGGGGDSESTSTTATTNVDKRAAVGDQSVLVSSDTSTVSVEVLDGGSIDLARKAVSANNTALKDVLDFAKVVLSGAVGVVADNKDLAEGAIATVSSGVKDAYAAEQVGVVDKNTLMLAGLGAAALVAVKVWGKK